MWSAEEKSLLWLDSFPLEPLFKRALLEKAGGAVKLVKGFAAFEGEFSDKESFLKMQESLQDGSYFAAVKARIEDCGVTPVFYGAKGYPTGWLSLRDAPVCLYAKGNLSLLDRQLFAVVGSRRTTAAVKQLGKTISQSLAKRFTIITGAADGGDEAALSGALTSGGAICFLAGGYDHAPKENPLVAQAEGQGLVIAASPMGTPVRVYSYEYRNKLLAAASEGVLVLSAAQKSGALITAAYAKKQEKKVFAIPYAPGSQTGEGCNALLKDGAFLTETADDILAQYGMEGVIKALPVLSETEQKVLGALSELGEAHVSQIASATQIPVFKLATVLASLEVKGAAVKTGGNRYAAV